MVSHRLNSASHLFHSWLQQQAQARQQQARDPAPHSNTCLPAQAVDWLECWRMNQAGARISSPDQSCFHGATSTQILSCRSVSLPYILLVCHISAQKSRMWLRSASLHHRCLTKRTDLHWSIETVWLSDQEHYPNLLHDAGITMRQVRPQTDVLIYLAEWNRPAWRYVEIAAAI